MIVAVLLGMGQSGTYCWREKKSFGTKALAGAVDDDR